MPRRGASHAGELIGAPGFEPGTSPTRTARATRLRHAPRARSLAACGAAAEEAAGGVSERAGDRGRGAVEGVAEPLDRAVDRVGGLLHSAADRAAAGQALDGPVNGPRRPADHALHAVGRALDGPVDGVARAVDGVLHRAARAARGAAGGARD